MSEYLELTLEVEGETFADVEAAVEEAVRRIKGGYTSGIDQNETGRFHFSLDSRTTSEPEPEGSRTAGARRYQVTRVVHEYWMTYANSEEEAVAMMNDVTAGEVDHSEVEDVYAEEAP